MCILHNRVARAKEKIGEGSQGSWQKKFGRKGGEPKEKGDKDGS